MCVEEKPPRSSLAKVKVAHSEGYEWVPAGLSSGQVCAVVYLNTVNSPITDTDKIGYVPDTDT